ncbi:MAG: hypothetical protein KC766_18415 [Myxococcales bacterium]|nr:hypothetical protein [Myxococcales bacterium]
MTIPSLLCTASPPASFNVAGSARNVGLAGTSGFGGEGALLCGDDGLAVSVWAGFCDGCPLAPLGDDLEQADTANAQPSTPRAARRAASFFRKANLTETQ